MAVIREEMLIVKVSTLVKNNSANEVEVFNEDVVTALEEAISEMVGTGHVVEIIKE